MAIKDLEEIREVAGQLRLQLEFYSEMGISEIGSGVSSQPGPALESTGGTEGGEPVGTSVEASTPESTLFGDPVSRGPGPVAAAGLPVAPDTSLEAISQDIGDCTRCRLHEGRRNIVFGEGNPNAKLMFVGEGPGADEDASGRPFVGRAGQLLNKIIESINLKREEVYIANVVKCRPPGNRTPERDEVQTCSPFLFRQIAVVKPEVIVALGLPAFQCLMNSRESLSQVRGDWRELNGIKVMPTFHPAYLLRSPARKKEVWEDMKKVRDHLNELKKRSRV